MFQAMYEGGIVRALKEDKGLTATVVAFITNFDDSLLSCMRYVCNNVNNVLRLSVKCCLAWVSVGLLFFET